MTIDINSLAAADRARNVDTIKTIARLKQVAITRIKELHQLHRAIGSSMLDVESSKVMLEIYKQERLDTISAIGEYQSYIDYLTRTQDSQP